MSALTLITGRLANEPTTRPTRNGGEVTFFKLKVATGSRIDFWSVATFSGTARDELAGLNEGDALSAVGELQVETYDWNGGARVNLKLTADRISALKPPPKSKDKAGQSAHATGRAIGAASWAAPTTGGAYDGDDIPF
jgi:single-stranded DNA-binding protein